MSQPLPGTTAILAHDISNLCNLDESYIRAKLSQAPAKDSPETRVALIPDAHTIQWHHAREEFAADELFDRHPEVKGAMADSRTPGGRVWCIWTRTYGTDTAGNTLNILRLVIEGEDDIIRQAAEPEEEDDEGLDALAQKKMRATMLVLQAAQHEAAKWGMRDVQVWNPTQCCVAAAMEIRPNIKVVEREEESIASLRWHGLDLGEEGEVEWIGNEKYGWC